MRGQLDGRDPGKPNYPPLPWSNVSLYREWDFGQPLANRTAGADNGRKPGETWSTPSRLDQVTVLAEILTKRYKGQTVMHMITALFAVLVEGRPVEEVRKSLGLK